jgi:hypothetical protein
MFGFDENKNCKKCKKSMDDFDYKWNGGKCDSCKSKENFRIALLVGLIALLVAVPLGYVQYNYEVGKCSNLKVSETDYGFTHNIEIDANYNENCYNLRNHPLAILRYLFIYPLFAGIMFGMIGFMISLMRVNK